MFFKQIFRNGRKNIKNNGLFFGSLVAAVVAFYTLLSMGEQDVMRFLRTMESDAVQKLMMLIPAIYVVSLFFVSFSSILPAPTSWMGGGGNSACTLCLA